MQKNILATGLLVAVLLPMVLPNLAFAQYGGAAQNAPTLEEDLKLAKARIAAVQANPHAGSGTPFLSGGSDVVTAMLVTAGIFGTLFVIFVYRAHTIALKQEQEARR